MAISSLSSIDHNGYYDMLRSNGTDSSYDDSESADDQSPVSAATSNAASDETRETAVTNLLSSLTSSSDEDSASIFGALGSSSLLTDRSLIQSGVYQKMMKAYYAKLSAEGSADAGTKTTSLKSIRKSSSDLKSAALALTGSALYSAATSSDSDSLVLAVKDFISSYNSVLDGLDNVESTNVLRVGVNMVNSTESVKSQLNSVGITINSDNSLSLDETALSSSGTAALKALFAGSASYASSIAQKAGMILSNSSSSITSYAGDGASSIIGSSSSVLVDRKA